MRLHFVSYDPTKGPRNVDPTSELSPQKHAAREYHRKANLLKTALKKDRQAAGSNTFKFVAVSGKRSNSAKHDHSSNTGRQPDDGEEGDRQILDPKTLLGAGRLDPFDAYCTRGQPLIVHEMLDHAVTNQWALFAADESPGSLLAVKKTVMDMAIRDPLCFYTLVFAGATHKAFHQSPSVDNSKSAILRLTSKTEAIQALTAVVQSKELALTDEAIFAMTLLAIHGSGEKVTGAPKQEKRTLAAMQDGQFYASMEYEWRHFDALKEIVKLKGGLQTIRFPGLAFAIASFDIHTSLMALRRPSFPPLMPSSLVLGSWPTSQPGSPASQLSPNLAVGFEFLGEMKRLPEANDLLNVIHGMREVTIGFDSYQRGDPDAPPIKMIGFARNLNQHELLSLPDLSHELGSNYSRSSTRSEFDDESSPGSSNTTTSTQSRSRQPQSDIAVYELCRLGALVFQLTVLLPNLHNDPEVTIPWARRLCDCLQHAVDTLYLHQRREYHELLLWVGVMGAWVMDPVLVAPQDITKLRQLQRQQLREWFVEFLGDQCRWRKAGMGDEFADCSWPAIRVALAKFLWLDSECEIPCSEIWEEAQAAQIPGEQCIVC